MFTKAILYQEPVFAVVAGIILIILAVLTLIQRKYTLKKYIIYIIFLASIFLLVSINVRDIRPRPHMYYPSYSIHNITDAILINFSVTLNIIYFAITSFFYLFWGFSQFYLQNKKSFKKLMLTTLIYLPINGFFMYLFMTRITDTSFNLLSFPLIYIGTILGWNIASGIHKLKREKIK